MALKIFLLIVYFSFYLYCFETSSEKGSRMQLNNTSQALASLCPYNRFCSSSPLKDDLRSGQMPCCEKCSCSFDCREIGSCCPDMPLAGIFEPKYPCIHMSDIAKQIDALPLSKFSHLWFHIITDCPDNEKALAYPRCLQPREIQDFMVVSDPASGRVYRNKHCAECNQIKKFVNWKLQVFCLNMRNLIQFKSLEERDKYLLENCSISSFPPDLGAGDMSSCVPESHHVISKCNYTGEWDFYDKEIEEACLENRDDQNALFKKNIDSRTYITYASVYCYICNVAHQSKATDYCKLDIEQNGYRTGLVSLTAILEGAELEEETEMTDIHCKSAEIWDSFTDMCRPLICQSGKIPFQGSCRAMFSNLDGYAIAIHFEVIFLTKTTVVNNRLLGSFENRFFWELGNDLKCGKCYSALLTGWTPSSQLYLRSEVYSTDECTSDMLLQRIRKLAVKKKMYLEYDFEGNQFQIALKLIYEEIGPGDSFQQIVGTTHGFCTELRVIDPSIIHYCPRIKLTPLEANNLKQNLLIASKQANDIILDDYEVCLESYFIAQQALSSSAMASIFRRHNEVTNGIWLKVLVIAINYLVGELFLLSQIT